MLQSMTGFGAAAADIPGWSVSVEIKSVNHRYFDAVVRLPSELMALEIKVVSRLRERLKRGKVYAVINVERTGDKSGNVSINRQVTSEILGFISEIRESSPVPVAPLAVENLLGIEGVLQQKTDSGVCEEIWPVLSESVTEATEALILTRQKEGQALEGDISGNLASLAESVSLISKRSDQVPMEARDRLKRKIEPLMPDIDIEPDRLAAEVAFIAERSDISEEISRLEAHMASLGDVIVSPENTAGKRMDFLCQELLREINTIGSKAGDLKINESVISAKTCIERIREQVQNVL